jgi:hypothetical protein
VRQFSEIHETVFAELESLPTGRNTGGGLGDLGEASTEDSQQAHRLDHFIHHHNIISTQQYMNNKHLPLKASLTIKKKH